MYLSNSIIHMFKENSDENLTIVIKEGLGLINLIPLLTAKQSSANL